MPKRSEPPSEDELTNLLPPFTGKRADSPVDDRDWVSTSSTYRIQDVEGTIERGQAGDVVAAAALYRHFRFSVCDHKEGVRWLRAAAELGDPGCMHGLSMHLHRQGETREAILWSEKALRSGIDDARNVLDCIRRESGDSGNSDL